MVSTRERSAPSLPQDGRTTIAALEHAPLPQIPDDAPAGARITVAGPVVCRRGVLVLANPAAVKYLGGATAQGGSSAQALNRFAETRTAHFSIVFPFKNSLCLALLFSQKC